MDAKTLENLNAHAEKVANRLGVHAAVELEQRMERSDSNPEGLRLVLCVFRDSSGPRPQINFPPNAPDLQARIEKEIPVLAQQL
jgi:hypothetical protein